MRSFLKSLIGLMVVGQGLSATQSYAQAPAPIVIDDTDANAWTFTSGTAPGTGTPVLWGTIPGSSSAKTYNNTNYHSIPATNITGNSVAANASLKAQLPESGVYRLEMWWPKVIPGGQLQVAVTYISQGAPVTYTAVIDQSSVAGQWYKIGLFNFQKSAVSKVLVKVTAITGKPGYVDAVRLVKIEPSLTFNTDNKAANPPKYRKAANQLWVSTPGNTWTTNGKISSTTTKAGAAILLHTPIQYGGTYHVYFQYPNSASKTDAAKRSATVVTTVYSDTNGVSSLSPIASPSSANIDETKDLSPDEPGNWVWVGDYKFLSNNIAPSIGIANNTEGRKCVVGAVRLDLVTDSALVNDIGSFTYNASAPNYTPYSSPTAGWSVSDNNINTTYPNFGKNRLSTLLNPFIKKVNSHPNPGSVTIPINANINGRFGVFVYVSADSDGVTSVAKITATVSSGIQFGSQTFPIRAGAWNPVGTLGNVALFGGQVVTLTVTPDLTNIANGKIVSLNVDAVRLVPIAPVDTANGGNGIDDAVETFFYGNTNHDMSLGANSDHLSDGAALLLGLDPTKSDNDNDGMSDAWEVANSLNPSLDDALEDPDGDGLLNWQEFLLKTNPRNTNSPDGMQDTNGDGIPNLWEFQAGVWAKSVANQWTRQSGPNPLVGVPSNANTLDPNAQGSGTTGMTYLQRYSSGLNPAGAIVFDTVDLTVSSGANSISAFTITRSSPAGSLPGLAMNGKPIAVNYAIDSSSTAVYGTDYSLSLSPNGPALPSSGTLSFDGTQNPANLLLYLVQPAGHLISGSPTVKLNLVTGFYNFGSSNAAANVLAPATFYPNPKGQRKLDVVRLNSTTPGATIFYTTDGSTPSHSGITPQGSTIAVKAGSLVRVRPSNANAGVVKAIVSSNGALDSSVTAASYLGKADVFTAGDHSFATLPIPGSSNTATWTWGSNIQGALGLGDTNQYYLPQTLSAFNNALSVTGISGFTAAVKADGTVWTWGKFPNSLGDIAQTASSLTPVQVANISGVAVKVAACGTHVAVLTSSGAVYGWGDNQQGDLGNGSTTSSSTPVQVQTDANHYLADIIDIAVGAKHCVALKKDGTVWTWGANDRGQLGINSNTNALYATQVRSSTNALISGFVEIAAGDDHTIGLQSDSTVRAWGANQFAQLGEGTTNNKMYPVTVSKASAQPLTGIIDVSAGENTSYGVDADGTQWAWGDANSGQFGNGLKANNSAYVTSHSVSDHILASRGGKDFALSIRGTKTFSVWASGLNDANQLGDGSIINNPYPVLVSLEYPDSDGDGLKDWAEDLYHHTDPFDWDTNDDGLSDLQDLQRGIDPVLPYAFATTPTPIPTPTPNAADHTAPTITLTQPTGATLTSP